MAHKLLLPLLTVLSMDDEIIIDDSGLFYGHKLFALISIVYAFFIIVVTKRYLKKSKPRPAFLRILLVVGYIIMMILVLFTVLLFFAVNNSSVMDWVQSFF